MSWSNRRALFLLAALAALGTLSGVGHVLAQKRPPKGGPMPPIPGKPVRDAFDLGDLTLPKEEDLQERVEAAGDNIKNAIKAGDKEAAVPFWRRACETLQLLLIRDGDVFVPLKKKDAEGREADIYVSVKKEAAEMIGAMPKAGREFYETMYGGEARKLVEAGKTNNDFLQISQAMSRFLYTKAGAEAATWLGTRYLDRAEFQGAARIYSILIARTGLTNKEELKDKTLIKAAIAFHGANDTESKRSYEAVFAELKNRGVELKLRDEALTAADIKADLDKTIVYTSEQSASDSPLFRGGRTRTTMLAGGTPFLEPSWKIPMAYTDQTKGYLRTAETALQSRALTMLSSFVPVTATIMKDGKKVSVLAYRSWRGVHAINMADGKQMWGAPNDWGLDFVHDPKETGRDTNKINYYSSAISAFSATNARPQMILENSVQGMLSADSRNVYTVEDLAVPPPAQWFLGGGMPGYGPVVQAAMNHNKLVAYGLGRGGRLVWEVGGTGKDPLHDTFFLSAPLPLNNKLYVLCERQQEIRLAALDPNNGKTLSIQPLANLKNLRMQTDPLRRTQAANLAYAEGILVVPTNAGAVFGVDTMSNALLWAYPYREVGAPAGVPALPPGVPVPGAAGSLQANWQVTAPAIADGKVIFTAPDGRNIHCINLRDGTRQWAAPREDGDLYFAGVYGGKALVVGEKSTRALSLKNGAIDWRVDTGRPSGLGAASNTGGTVMFYLPIRESLSDRKPEILAIDVARGFIHAHTRSRKGEVPGNLLFFEGRVLSQSHTEVAAYPQIEVELARLDKLVADKPNDPALLTERGDYLLDKGELVKAIADLRKARDNKPDDKTLPFNRAKLYEAFTELFQRDFVKAETYIKEYEEACKVDLEGLTGDARTAAMADARRRQANFLCLVGKGREGQGRLVEAFEKYLELGTGARPDELIQVIDEPSVKAAPDVWSQGRIDQMIRNAGDAKAKAELERLITARWEKVKAGKADELRKYVAMFGSLFGVGREARFTLAEKLMEDTDLNSLLEAEQVLSNLRSDPDDQTAARAIEALARLNTRKGLLEDAAYYYRVLGERYPNIKVGGMKGSEHLEDLSTDKRFLPYLGNEARFKVKGKVRFDSRPMVDAPHSTAVYQFANLGDQMPYFVRNKIGFKLDWTRSLEISDTATGDKKIKQLDNTAFQQVIQNPLFTTAARIQFGFQNIGHTVVLQLGHKVYGIDPLGKEPRILWTENLSQMPGTDVNPPQMDPARPQPTFDPRDGAAVMEYSDGSMQRLGVGGPLQAGVVCLLRRDSLTAIDPVTGRKLWVRTDITSRSHIFGDGQNIYVVAIDPRGNAAGTRAIRAHDGVSVKARDFSAEFDSRKYINGRTILSKVTNLRNESTLSLYDVVDGKTVWQHQFPAGTVVVDSTDPDLVGGVEPATGKVTVFSLKARKAVLEKTMRDAKHSMGAEAVTLVADPEYLFLAVKQPDDPNVIAGVWWNPAGGGQVNGTLSNMQPGIGVRTAKVNGMVYAFRRKDNALMWFNPVANSQIVLSGVEDSPALHFNARYMGWIGAGGARSQQMVYTALSFAKHNGKMCLDQPNMPQNMYITEYTVDQRTGDMAMIGQGKKWSIIAEQIK